MVRSILFVPAIQPRFIEKAPTVGADAICLDLEDSVPPTRKANAREMVGEAMAAMSGQGLLLLVRVNGLDTGLLEDDLAAVLSPELYGISLPKAHTPEIVKEVDASLGRLERECGMAEGRTKLVPWIESALAVWRSYDVCHASPRVVGAAFGAEDFTADMGISRSKQGLEIAWPRAVVAVAARGAGIVSLGTVVVDFNDQEFLEEDCRLERSLGYQGKFCIHPRQVEVVNRVFRPADDEIDQARRVILAYETGETQGVGAVALDGEMVDRPVYVRAQRLLDRASAFERISGLTDDR